MATHSHCLLFIDARLLVGSKPSVTGEGSSNEDALVGRTKGYALIYAPDNWRQNSFVIRALSECGVEVVDSEEVIPTPNTNFEAMEVCILTSSTRVVRIHSSERLRPILDSSRVKVHTAHRSCQSLKMTQISSDRLCLIEKLLATRGDVVTTGDGDNLLHFSIKRGQRALFERLLDLGADVERRNAMGKTPLHVAVSDENIPVSQRKALTEALLRKGADARSKDSSCGLTPLHVAAGSGFDGVVEVLLQNGAEVDARSEDSKTPLHIAVEKGRDNVISILLKYGADVNSTDSQGATPLLYVSSDCPDYLTRLFNLGASLDAQTKNNETVLLRSVQGKWHHALEYIVRQKLNPSVEGNKRAFYIALMEQIRDERFVRVVEQMVGRGFTAHDDCPAELKRIYQSQLKTRDPSHIYTFRLELESPLLAAIRNNDADLVRLLLSRGANLNAECFSRRSQTSLKVSTIPLTKAIELADLDVVQVLIEAGAIDRADTRLLPAALRGNQLRTVEFLLQEDFGPNFRTSIEPTCIWTVFVSRLDKAMIDVLAKYGVQLTYSNLPEFLTIHLYDQTRTDVFERFLNYCPLHLSLTDQERVRGWLGFDANPQMPPHSFPPLAGHVIKAQVLNPEVKSRSLIPEAMFERFSLGRLKEECELESARLSETIPDTYSITYRDVTSGRSAHKVARYVRNATLAAAMESDSVKTRFPKYADMLISRFKMGMRLRSLMDEATPVFKALVFQFSSNFPDVVVEMIFQFLDIRDLMALQKCLPTKQL